MRITVPVGASRGCSFTSPRMASEAGRRTAASWPFLAGMLLACVSTRVAAQWSEPPNSNSGLWALSCAGLCFRTDRATYRPMVVAFHSPTISRGSSAPDVLFSEEYWSPPAGGPILGGVIVGCDALHPKWYVPRNYRVTPTLSSIVDVVALGPGEMWFDSDVATE